MEMRGAPNHAALLYQRNSSRQVTLLARLVRPFSFTRLERPLHRDHFEPSRRKRPAPDSGGSGKWLVCVFTAHV